MPNVVIVRNTYPDDQSMLRVIHYALDKAVTVGAYGTSPNAEVAYMQICSKCFVLSTTRDISWLGSWR